MPTPHPAFIGNHPELVDQVFNDVELFTKEIEDFNARIRLLAEDCHKCIAFLNIDKADQFWRRSQVKNIFVLVEAAAYGLKQISIENYQRRDIPFTVAELAILREEKYNLE